MKLELRATVCFRALSVVTEDFDPSRSLRVGVMPTEPMALEARSASVSPLIDCGEVCNEDGTELSLNTLECPGLVEEDDSGEFD